MQQDLQAQVRVSLWKRILIGRNPRRTMVRAAGLLVFSYIVFRHVLLPVRVVGRSMEPSYRDGSINAVNRLAYVFRKPRRGDVVGVRFSDFHIQYLKRIVGLPGETVAITNGIVYINGQPLDEPYVKDRDSWELAPVLLPDDNYFVIGDNRGMDQRLHDFGMTESARIVGKALW